MKKAATSSTCYQLEGNLFLSNQLEKAFVGQNRRQKPQDYQLPPGIAIKEECSRAFRIGKASWDRFAQIFSRTDLTEQDRLERTKEFAKNLLGGALGYQLIPIESIEIGDRKYPLVFTANGLSNEKNTASLAVAIIQPPNTLDTAVKELAVEGSGTSRKSAFSLVQEFLNAADNYRWGFAFNGSSIRLVRDSMSLTRPSFLEFNLQEIFQNEDYAEFMHLWMVLHASRVTLIENNTAWDLWIKEGEEEGQPAREALSASIKTALLTLGNGFIQEPGNVELRKALAEGTLTAKEYTHELLRLMYRFLFVFCLEERELLHVKEDSDANRLARERYQLGYSFHRYREMSRKKRFQNKFTDAWESVKIVFKGLEAGEPLLALPALGGLFKETQDPHLSKAALPNTAFFEAMYSMRWAEINKVLAPIDYKNMGTEELGSIYESLLELVPVVDTTYKTFSFMSDTRASNERKKTGSYYTPDPFVQLLIKNTLDPVIKKRLLETPETPEKALLSLSVIDPACGSGHFLLAAARRIAEKLALVRAHDEIVTPHSFRLALRDVIQHCIYGVDLNPLAVELARMALWLEGYAEGCPLSFLDHHLKVGNSLLGVFDLDNPKWGITAEAYKKTDKDDAEVCKALKARNTPALNNLRKILDVSGNTGNLLENIPIITFIDRIEAINSKDLQTEKSKEELYKKHLSEIEKDDTKQAADVLIAAYIAEKTIEAKDLVPTSEVLAKKLLNPDALTLEDIDKITFATKICKSANVFHWPLEFPQVFAKGGFDCILGNPPWEKAKVVDKEWFKYRQAMIADEKLSANARKKMITALKEGNFGIKYLKTIDSKAQSEADRELYGNYVSARQRAAAASHFYHLKSEDFGRFPMTGKGDTNLYAYFAELALNLRKADGTVGLVLPVGIITDTATMDYSSYILDGHLKSLYHFNNTKSWFPIHTSYSFLLMTLDKTEKPDFVFYAVEMEDLEDPKRHISFDRTDFKLFSPNTGSCPLPRAQQDVELCRKLYQNVPVLVNENQGEMGNPWELKFLRMFDMTNDSKLFHKEKPSDGVPLYEGKLLHQFDNRWATYDVVNSKGDKSTRDVTQKEKEDVSYQIEPKYWVSSSEVKKKFQEKKTGQIWWNDSWMLAFRDISSPTNERTVIATVLPSNYAVGNNAPLLFPEQGERLSACLLGNLNSLILDYVERIKQPSTHVNLYLLEQLPVLPPSEYTEIDINYIVERIAKLTRNNSEINEIWLKDYPTYQFQSPEERLQIRAELDAYYAHLYGLTRDELRYILDPSDVMGKNFHSVTFPGLKANEKKKFGEYLTQRLVLEAYDNLANTERFSNKSDT